MGFTKHSELSVLAIGAHPDDIELGCGGSLAKLKKRGAHISAIVLSNGACGAPTHADRAQETKSAFAAIGIEYVHLYSFTDTDLFAQFTEIVAVIERHVREIRPDRVYTMYDKDRHQDHQAVYEASSIACRNVPQILGYETPSSYQNFQPTLFERIGDVLALKLRALSLHKSQNNKPYMQEDSVRVVAQFRGIQSGFMEPSEAFIPYRIAL